MSVSCTVSYTLFILSRDFFFNISWDTLLLSLVFSLHIVEILCVFYHRLPYLRNRIEFPSHTPFSFWLGSVSPNSHYFICWNLCDFQRIRFSRTFSLLMSTFSILIPLYLHILRYTSWDLTDLTLQNVLLPKIGSHYLFHFLVSYLTTASVSHLVSFIYDATYLS